VPRRFQESRGSMTLMLLEGEGLRSCRRTASVAQSSSPRARQYELPAHAENPVRRHPTARPPALLELIEDEVPAPHMGGIRLRVETAQADSHGMMRSADSYVVSMDDGLDVGIPRHPRRWVLAWMRLVENAYTLSDSGRSHVEWAESR
jgi:hypothetical protein